MNTKRSFYGFLARIAANRTKEEMLPIFQVFTGILVGIFYGLLVTHFLIFTNGIPETVFRIIVTPLSTLLIVGAVMINYTMIKIGSERGEHPQDVLSFWHTWNRLACTSTSILGGIAIIFPVNSLIGSIVLQVGPLVCMLAIGGSAVLNIIISVISE